MITDHDIYAAVALMNGATFKELVARFGQRNPVSRSLARLRVGGYLSCNGKSWAIAKFLPADCEPDDPLDYPVVTRQAGQIPEHIAQRSVWQI